MTSCSIGFILALIVEDGLTTCLRPIDFSQLSNAMGTRSCAIAKILASIATDEVCEQSIAFA
ncbi:hypothetical protein ACKFKG_17990 [Phormidesmis sp. 146-35]